MIFLDEISGEIAKLENQPATYVTMEKLAWLYIVRDHITLSQAKGFVSAANTETIPDVGTSDFLIACAGKPMPEVMLVMDELMETLNSIHPKLYTAVMDRLK